MKTTKQLLGAVSAIALIAMSSAPALAAGTDAGTTITNNVSVTFDVGGLTQNAETATDTFTVDRRVDVNVEYVGPVTSVTPGEDDAIIMFDVTNLSNDTIDLALSTALTGGETANIDNYRIYADTNGNNTYDAGVDTLVTHLDEVVEDDTIRVFVLADIGLDAANADEFDVTLTANAHLGGGAGALGTELTDTAGANNVNSVDTVLVDGTGATDVANDGAFSDTGTYTVAGALVTLTKTSRVISDPVNLPLTGGAANPDAKAIPGAIVEYCIKVANDTGAATATNVNVVDNLPGDVSYLDTFGIFINGDDTCANGTSGGSFGAAAGPASEDQVTGVLDDIAAGVTRSLYFRVEIN